MSSSDPRPTPSTDAGHHERLETIGEALRTSWHHDLLPLLVSRQSMEQLAAELQRYGAGGRLIHEWYRHFVVASCRRIVDTGDDVRSLRQALLDLRGVADGLTADVLVAYHRGRLDHWRDEYDAAVAASFHGAVEAAGAAKVVPESQALVRAVQADIDRIRELADRVHRSATAMTAHRLTEKRVAELVGDQGVTDAELDELLEFLVDIAKRWCGLIAWHSIDPSVEGLHPELHLHRALTLYKHDAFTDALARELRSREGLPRDLAGRARAHYTFDAEEG